MCNVDLVFLNYFPCEMEFFIDENDVYTMCIFFRAFFHIILFISTRTRNKLFLVTRVFLIE